MSYELQAAASGMTNQKEPLVSEILKLLDKVTDMAVDLHAQVDGKLQSVMSPPEVMEAPAPAAGTRQYPPLFEAFREKLQAVARSLEGIQDCLRRTEL